MSCYRKKKFKPSFILVIFTFALLILFDFTVFSSVGNDIFNGGDLNSVKEFYPLIIYGGEPEGVAAAISAAREGIETLLILKRDKPGGLMTYGGLNFLDINQGPDGKNLNKGFFSEWHQRVGGKITFSINKATEVFEDIINNEKNISVINNGKLLKVKKEKGKISSILLETSAGIEEINANYLIDASQDADLAVFAGAPFFKGGADIGLEDRHMAATLVLHLDNIDWQDLAKDVKSNKFGPSYINKDNAWGFVEIGQLYQPVDKNTKMRGLNIVIEEKGESCEVYINALLVFDFDPTDHSSLEIAYENAKKEAYHVLDFLKAELAGFEDAELMSFPEELYVREGRHILTEYQLKVSDLFNNRIAYDTIALASYPLDYQASSPDYNGFVLFNPDIYGIPLRSLLPKDLDNIFVVGRSSGYSSLAAASARVLPTGMSTGEAAGLVVSYLIKDNISIEELINDEKTIDDLQRKLKINEDLRRYKDNINRNLIMDRAGIERNLSSVFNKIKDLLSIDNNALINNVSDINEMNKHIEYLLSWGLIIGGYENDFRLGEEISEREFAHIIIKGLKQQDSPILYDWVPGGLETMSNNKPLTRDQAAMLLVVAISKPISDIEENEYFNKAIEYNLIPDIISTNIKEDRVLTRTEAYILISSFLQDYPLSDELKFYRGD